MDQTPLVLLDIRAHVLSMIWILTTAITLLLQGPVVLKIIEVAKFVLFSSPTNYMVQAYNYA